MTHPVYLKLCRLVKEKVHKQIQMGIGKAMPLEWLPENWESNPPKRALSQTSVFQMSFFQSEIYFENSSSMGKHCPGLCLYPAPALIHIRCLINTGNYRVGRSERLIRTSVHCLSPEHCVAAGVLALGCSISGSGLEQLSALIVRLMARHCCCCWAPQPRTQGALPPQGWLPHQQSNF